MADVKISGLPASTVPLAGTEVLPIVQSGVTKQVSIANVTAGRPIFVSKLTSDDGIYGRWNIEQGITNNIQSATTGFGDWKIGTLQANAAGPNMTWDTAGNTTVGIGNLIIGVSGKGIDFSATAGTGTSELLNDYEEGTWTPAWSVSGGTITSFGAEGTYTKIGNRVLCKGYIAYGNAVTGSPTGQLSISGLPFAANATGVGQSGNRFSGDLLGSSLYWTTNAPSTGWIAAGASTIILLSQGATGVASTTYADMSRGFNNSDQIYFEVLYYV